jgi:hypothetical protein
MRSQWRLILDPEGHPSDGRDNSCRLLAAPRPLPLNNNCLFGAFKIAHGHVGVRVFAPKILRGFDGQLLAVIIGPRPAVDRNLPARAETQGLSHRSVDRSHTEGQNHKAKNQ